MYLATESGGLFHRRWRAASSLLLVSHATYAAPRGIQKQFQTMLGSDTWDHLLFRLAVERRAVAFTGHVTGPAPSTRPESRGLGPKKYFVINQLVTTCNNSAFRYLFMGFAFCVLGFS
jgi:hypothetical protein